MFKDFGTRAPGISVFSGEFGSLESWKSWHL